MRHLGLAAAAAVGMWLASLGGAPASARDLPAAGVTRQEIAAWLTAHGHKAVQHADSNGEQIVSSADGGVNFDIYFFICSPAGRCKSIQYAAGWSGMPAIDVQKLNDWNTTKRYIRAYHKPNDVVWGEYDVDLMGPGGGDQLDKSWDRWTTSLATFKTFIGG